jgi:hypothetical protein
MKPDKSRDVDLDAAIDRAVRSMMSAEPRAGMRQRVLARIHEAPRRAFPMWRLAIAGGGVAAMALAVAIRVGYWPMHPEDVAPVVVTSPPPAEPAAPPTRQQPSVQRVPPPIVATPPVARTPAPSQRIPRGLVVAQSLALPEDDDVRTASPMPEALPGLEPIAIAPLRAIQSLDIPAVQIEAIEFKPIGVSRLPDIAPLQGPLR